LVLALRKFFRLAIAYCKLPVDYKRK
jgi:hypothetical protein